MNKLYMREIPSPTGSLSVFATDQAIVATLWLDGDRARAPSASLDPSPAAKQWLDRAESQLAEYFAGERRTFDLPLDPQGTDFQKRAWAALARIPYGETRSYGELAREIGCPKGPRAVGSANGRNPICVIIPCHRAIGADGSLTGFSAGIERKKALLALEGSIADSKPASGR